MRRPDWDERLSAYLTTMAAEPHAYGRHDCMTFAAGAVKALTGRDPARGHRGKYGSAKAAARYLKSLGFNSPAAMIYSVLKRKPVAFAGRGDIVADAKGVPGVCIGGDALFVGQDGEAEGLVRKPRSDWRKAWHV